MALVVSAFKLCLCCIGFCCCAFIFFIDFLMFIWNSNYYDVIGQKNYYYLVSGFKFFPSKEIKIIVRKIFYGGNLFTKPCSKEDRIIVNFNIFVVPYDRFFCTGLGIIQHILKHKTSIAVFLYRRVVAP